MYHVRPGGKGGTNGDFLMCNQSAGLNWNLAKGGGMKAGEEDSWITGLSSYWYRPHSKRE